MSTITTENLTTAAAVFANITQFESAEWTEETSVWDCDTARYCGRETSTDWGMVMWTIANFGAGHIERYALTGHLETTPEYSRLTVIISGSDVEDTTYTFTAYAAA
ncbi:hypothetical protein [Tsukamurella hominis]|uniref:hypothetical protein n=1 Tax=Tsukamurella hominis TaxID=1970232 RepID=UPI0039ED151D